MKEKKKENKKGFFNIKPIDFGFDTSKYDYPPKMMYIKLAEKKIKISKELVPDQVIADLDKDGNIIGIEIIDFISAKIS